MMNKNTYIIQIEGKDILNLGKKGLAMKDNNKKKYKATADYSLECIQLNKVAKAVYKDNPEKQNIFYTFNDKQYTDAFISVTFEYSVKEFAEKYIKKDKENKYYVRYENIDDVKLDKIEFDENGKYYIDDEELVAFRVSKDTNNDKLCGDTVKTAKDVREALYESGFIYNKNRYIRFKRSSGSSRIGKCLFILEDLYNDMMEWSLMGLTFNENEKYDLAALEAYIALTTSSIIDTIKISPKNILLIEEGKSIFTDTAMVTQIVNINGKDRLATEKDDEVEVENKIWDGQSLLEERVFQQWRHIKSDLNNSNLIKPNSKCTTKINKVKLMKKYNYNYSDKGFLLLRNRMTKTACFQTRIQKFFKDNNITSLDQINGITGAEKIEDILMITTKSSIKYMKFNNNFMGYVDELEDTWGVVKYEKPTHHFDGAMVSTHYQLLNTLQMDKETISLFLQPSFDYLKLLKTDINVFRHHLKISLGDSIEERELNNTNDLMFSMLEVNNGIEKTDIFQNFRDDVIDSYIKNMRKGHILINGTYAVLFGNSLEMLKATIKDKEHPMYWNGENSVLVGNEIHNINFKYNKELLGCRSPHCTMGNMIKFKNVECRVLDKYFYLTPQIVCVNSIKENLLERASSADFDSDQLILTDNQYLLEAMDKNYNNFLVPTSKVDPEIVKRFNTAKEKCDLDFNTSVNLIGDIINCSQQLNSRLWHMVNEDKKAIDSPEVKDLYSIICQLDVMSCIEIDKAKKEFPIDNQLELKEISKKYLDYELVDKKTYKRAPEKNIKLYDEFIEFQINKYSREDCKIFDIDYKQYREEYKNKLLNYRDTLKNYKLAKVRPMFFKYIAKKEYKDAKYYYRNYNTTMDILEEVITEKTKDIRAKRNSKKDLKQLIQIMDDVKYASADRKQIPRLIAKVEEYNNFTKAVWDKDNLESKEKYIKCKQRQNEIAEYYRDNITKETMYKIIYELCHSEKYDHIARKLITILFKTSSKVFLEIFNENKEKLPMLKRLYRKPIEGEEVIKIYDMNYLVVKK